MNIGMLRLTKILRTIFKKGNRDKSLLDLAGRLQSSDRRMPVRSRLYEKYIEKKK